MVKNIRYIFIIVCFCLFPLSITFSQSQVITLDNISKNVIAKFDRARAIFDKNILITSIQNNAIIPNNYSHPIIEWQGPEDYNDAFLIELKSRKNTLNVVLKNKSWQPEGSEFNKFLKEKEVLITIYRLDKGVTYKSQPVRLAISERSLDDRIAFRMVQPLFDPELPNAIKIFSFDQKLPVSLIELQGTCVGCHNYSANTAIFNIKRGVGRKLVTATRDDQEYSLDKHAFGDFSFFTISPDGKHGVLVRNPLGRLIVKKDFIEPFDYPYQAADVYIYNFEDKTLTPLKGASDRNFVEDMPSFSPDGQYVIFSRYQYSEKDGVRGIHSMDLYQVPFNNGNGGDPVPIKNASSNNMYQYFARYAPNGKWISFCRADGSKGIYARRSSDIYLLSTKDNSVTKLNLNLDNTMDSWHDWSSDSHWLIFSSNREKNRLTSLYLVYIDDNGKDYPPVKLVGSDNMKVNTPQFFQKNLNIEAIENLKDYIEGAPKQRRKRF